MAFKLPLELLIELAGVRCMQLCGQLHAGPRHAFLGVVMGAIARCRLGELQAGVLLPEMLPPNCICS